MRNSFLLIVITIYKKAIRSVINSCASKNLVKACCLFYAITSRECVWVHEVTPKSDEYHYGLAILLNSDCYLPSEILRYSLHTGSIFCPQCSTRRYFFLGHIVQQRILKYKKDSMEIMLRTWLCRNQRLFWRVSIYASHRREKLKLKSEFCQLPVA